MSLIIPILFILSGCAPTVSGTRYNISALMNGSNLGELAVATNTILGGEWYGYFILGTTFLITFVYLMGKGYKKSSCFATACWLMTILALFLRPMNIIGSWTFWICIFITPVSIFFLWLFAYSE